MTPELKNAIKAGAWTALFTFIGLFFLSAIGWVQDVAEWASSNGAVEFPDLSVLGYAAVSAMCAGVIGLFNVIVRAVQSMTNVGTIPSYDKPTDS